MDLSLLLSQLNSVISLHFSHPLPALAIHALCVTTRLPAPGIVGLRLGSPCTLWVRDQDRAVRVAWLTDPSEDAPIHLLVAAGHLLAPAPMDAAAIQALTLGAITADFDTTLAKAAAWVKADLALLPLKGQTIIRSTSAAIDRQSNLGLWLADHQPKLAPQRFWHHVALTQAPETPMPVLLTPLAYHGDPLGYLALVGTQHALDATQPARLAAVAPLITRAAVKDQVIASLSSRDRLLNQMLSADPGTNLTIQFAKQRAHLPSAMVLLTAAPLGPQSAATLKERLQYLLAPMTAQALVTIYRHQCVALIPLTLPQYNSAHFRQDLQSLATRGNCRLLVSPFYTRPEDTLAAYTVCQRTLTLPSPAKPVRFCADEFFSLLLSEVTLDRSVLAFFVSPTVPRLSTYDRSHKSALAKTLAAYLAHNGDQTETAAALYVHPNTLRNRLHRIEALTGIDLDDATVRFKLTAGFAVQAFIAAHQAEG